ncbi:MAG: type II toxin-antitoxin system ParD family antitoxin [Pyrinomonadaceae bacterium MAG19_C2-C3]|nr:type II toxin-antitoxin system ParD family antitoxin [Pyrinomonadaceae bacterium MAG19_C2-C3]
MNVSLTPELEELINQKVATGMYYSASEVVREGLRLLKEQDDLKRIRTEDLRRDIMRGKEQIARGEYKAYKSGAEVFQDITGKKNASPSARRTTGDNKTTNKQSERKRA